MFVLYSPLNVSVILLIIIRWNTGTEGKVLRRRLSFTIDLLKYIICYSKKRNKKKEE